MKRSEMIELFEKAHNTYYGHHYSDDPKECYSAILQKLEEAGMLPPPDRINWGVTDTIMYVYYDHQPMEDYKNPNKELLWEPEDEN